MGRRVAVDALFEMAQPARAFEQSSLADDEPVVSLHVSELDCDGSFEQGLWCVDYGNVIVCMSTTELRAAFAAGDVAKTVKVWRDGRALWQGIDEVKELTRRPPPKHFQGARPRALPKPPPVRVVKVEGPPPTRFPTEGCFDEPEVPDQSGVRRIRDRRAAEAREQAERAAERVTPAPAVGSRRVKWRRTGALLAAATVLSIMIALLYPVWLGTPGKLKRVAVDVGERCLFVAEQAKLKAREQRSRRRAHR